MKMKNVFVWGAALLLGACPIKSSAQAQPETWTTMDLNYFNQFIGEGGDSPSPQTRPETSLQVALVMQLLGAPPGWCLARQRAKNQQVGI